MKLLKIIILTVAVMGNSACRSDVRPAIVPGVEVKQPVTEEVKSVPQKHRLGVIGEVEPIYFLPMKKPFMARIDTGAETSSIDVANRTIFERDGEKWVSFDLVNREYGETYHFEKKVIRRQKVKRIDGKEARTVVMMNVRFGGEIIRAQFSLAERDKFEYQGLIGRNILNGRAVVDTSISNTLK